MKKAVITIIDTGYDYREELRMLEAAGFEASYVPLEGTDDTDRIAAVCADKTVVLAGPERWDEAAFCRCPQLKLLARLGAGTEKIDLDAATKHGVAVTHTPGANACSVAQHVVAFMLDLALSVTQYDRHMRAGDLARHYCHDLIGARVGFLGFGNVARTAAGLLKGFGAELYAYDLFPNEAAARELGVTMTTVEHIAQTCDFISLHVPLNAQTAGMVDRAFLQKMKPTAYLINTSRGGVIRERDLIAALEAREIAGAALDVYETMPPDCANPLIAMENVVHTPYVAYSSKLANRRALETAICGIRSFFCGETPQHLLNPAFAEHKR